MTGIDLGFSDYFEDQNVRDKTIVVKLELMLMEEESPFLGIEDGMNFSLFQALGDKHPTPSHQLKPNAFSDLAWCLDRMAFLSCSPYVGDLDI
jgi:hypothetical protein